MKRAILLVLSLFLLAPLAVAQVPGYGDYGIIQGGAGGGGGGGDLTPSTTTQAVGTSGSAGAATEYSRGDHVHAISGATVNTAVGTGSLDGNARVGVRKNSTGSTFARRRLNLIEGANVTITVADDSGGEEVDVTIAASGGGGGGLSDGDYGDITVSGGATSMSIDTNAVTFAKMQDIATDTCMGRATASTGDPETFTCTSFARSILDDVNAAAVRTTIGAASGSGSATGTNTGDQTITLTGDVTGSGTGSFAATVANNAVTNAKAADMANATVKCRTTAGTGDPEDCTATQTTALLNNFTSSLKGLAPASGGGTTNFLRADGTWAAPPGGGGGALWSKDYMADQFLPVGSGWNTTVMADLETYNLVNVIAYDPTTSQSRGLEVVLPTGATTITLYVDAAAAAGGFTTNNGIVMALECRQQYATGSFTQQLATAVTITDNATIQRKTFVYTLSGLSLTAGTVALCQFTRLPANGSDTMTQDWRVAHIGVVVN